MRKNIFVIGLIGLIIIMTFIPASTATITTQEISSDENTPPPQQPQGYLTQSWGIARIRGPLLFTEGWLINVDAENLMYASSFKIGNYYFYNDVHVIGTIADAIHRTPSFFIGRYLQNGICGQKVSVTASLLINNKPLEIQNGTVYFFSTVFNAKLEYLEE